MTIWHSLFPAGSMIVSLSPARLKRLAESGATVCLYHTAERGWYGWYTDVIDAVDDTERVYPILLADGTTGAVVGSQILKTAAAVQIGAPDEIS